MGIESPKSKEGIETITMSAISFPDRVFTGHTHADVMLEIEKTFPDWDDMHYNFIEGFMTSTGRFVNRAEAAKIAEIANQLGHLDPKRKAHAHKLLDSDDIEELRVERPD